jgi:hypothetical protein
MYNATIVGTVKLGHAVEHVRIPVQFFIRLVNRGRTISLEGPVWAAASTDYTIVGAESPLGGISTDWTMIPLRLAKGTTQIHFSLYDVKGLDQMDLFIFDNKGAEIDSTVSEGAQYLVPGSFVTTATTRGSPATLTIKGDGKKLSSPVGGGTPTLPTTIWIAVSDSGPAHPPSFSTFHLDINVTS